MANLKLASFVLFVEDVAKSKEFYEKILGLEVAMDINGINVGFKNGLAIWQRNRAQQVIFEKDFDPVKYKYNVEIYFETSGIDEIYENLRTHNITIIHEIKTQPWQQRVFRFYDPDNFIIEIGETMEDVIKRLYKSGMSAELVTEKTFMPDEIVKAIIKNL